jgi:pimeloyl-ACP methyl ester carboxylesterase
MPTDRIRIWPVRYLANGGVGRRAYVILPDDIGPGHSERLPLVVSPHGRGVTPFANVKLWGNLPAIGRFAVISPEGQGRRIVLSSWGWKGQIQDLARMREIAVETLPWLKIERRRFYSLGGSMGGQETLLLVALYGKRLAGAAAFDSATDLARRYRDFGVLDNGETLRRRARLEVGGTPETNPVGYALRSPLNYVRKIAFSEVPLQIWWSTADQIVIDQRRQSQLLYDRIRQANPDAPVTKVVGTWAHSAEMRATTLLPLALQKLGLLPV